MVVLNLEVSFFLTRIREKLLELDFDWPDDIGQAASADAFVLGIRRSGDENALMNGLHPDVEIDVRTLLEGDDPLTPLFGEGDGESVFAHLTGVSDDVADGHHERAVQSSLHTFILPADPEREAVPAERTRSDPARAGVEEGRHRSRHERGDIAAEPRDLAHERAGDHGMRGVRQ